MVLMKNDKIYKQVQISKQEKAAVRAALRDPETVKLIDRARKSVKSLTDSRRGKTYENSPAIQAVTEFLLTHSYTNKNGERVTMKSISNTKYIQTKTQLNEYLRFLNKFLGMETRTRKGAERAERKQKEGINKVLRDLGFKQLNDKQMKRFFDNFNKLDILNLMNELGVGSETIINAVAITTEKSRRFSINSVLKTIYGASVNVGNRKRFVKGTKENRKLRESRRKK